LATLESIRIRSNEIMSRIDTLTAQLGERYSILPPELKVEGISGNVDHRTEMIEAQRLERIADFLAQLEESTRPKTKKAAKE